MRVKIFTPVMLFGLLLLSGCSLLPPFPGGQPTVSIAGTVWSGKDSDGALYEYRFRKDGALHYQSPTGFWKNGSWKQRGNRVYMETNNRYTERQGTIQGNRMSGKARNIKGAHWTWQASKMVKNQFAAVIKPTPKVAKKTAWSYTGRPGPANWGALDPAFATCTNGNKQSPINLTVIKKGELPTLQLDYNHGGNEVINNGHTIQINVAAGNSMTVAGHRYTLKQIHFHAPGEHAIHGHTYPMEGHFVHVDNNGRMAIIAVLYKTGPANKALQKAWLQIPRQSGDKNNLVSGIDPTNLLPHKLDYYQYNGSLTTPPCTEGVSWFVMQYYNTLSKKQIDTFSMVMHRANNRPLMPRNNRTIMQ